MWQLIQSLHLQLQDDEDDQICWTLEASGRYSARSAYAAQFFGNIQSNFCKLIWKAWAPPKCKFFLWLLLRNRLWTAARLQSRGWENNYFCGLCIRSLETAWHLFVECPFSKAVWRQVANWSNCGSLEPSQWIDLPTIEDWFLHMIPAGGNWCIAWRSSHYGAYGSGGMRRFSKGWKALLSRPWLRLRMRHPSGLLPHFL